MLLFVLLAHATNYTAGDLARGVLWDILFPPEAMNPARVDTRTPEEIAAAEAQRLRDEAIRAADRRSIPLRMQLVTDAKRRHEVVAAREWDTLIVGPREVCLSASGRSARCAGYPLYDPGLSQIMQMAGCADALPTVLGGVDRWRSAHKDPSGGMSPLHAIDRALAAPSARRAEEAFHSCMVGLPVPPPVSTAPASTFLPDGLGQIVVVTDAPATIYVDSHLLPLNVGSGVFAEPGEHQLIVNIAGQPGWAGSVSVRAGETLLVERYVP